MRRPDGHGSGHDVEFRVIDPEGSLHWLVSKGLREYNSAGKAVRMRGVAFEVTKRKRAEEEIQKREALLVEAQRIARLGSYEWDVGTNTVRRSEELRRIFGLRSHVFESAFEGYLARVNPDDRSTTRRLIDQASRDRQPLTLRSASFGRTVASEYSTARDNSVLTAISSP